MSVLNNNICNQLKKCGLSATPTTNFVQSMAFRAPCVLFEKAVIKRSKIDMFSYVKEYTSITTSSIGRYCSIGFQSRLGVREHDISTLSSSLALNESNEFDFAGYHSNHNTQDRMQRHNETTSCITVGHDVWIGDYVLVTGDVSIGHGAVIRTHAHISKDVPPYTIVEGHDRIVKQRFSDELISDLLELQWWNYNLPEMIKQGATFNLDQPQEFIAQFKDLDPSKLIPINQKWILMEVPHSERPLLNLKLSQKENENFSLYFDPQHPEYEVVATSPN